MLTFLLTTQWNIYSQSREILSTFKITIDKLTFEIYGYLICLMYFSY